MTKEIILTKKLVLDTLFESSKGKQRPSAKKISSSANQDLISKLVNATGWLPSDSRISERLYVFIHDLSARPHCKKCNGDLHPSAFLRFKYSNGYPSFCSPKCSKNSSETKAALRNTCMEKYGVDHPFKSSEVKERIKTTCLTRYGVESTLCIESVKTEREKSLSKYYKNQEKLRAAALKRLVIDSSGEYTHIQDDELYLSSLLVKFIHTKCNTTFTQRLEDGKGPRCNACFPKLTNISSIHSTISSWLESNNIEFVENTRSLLIPSKKEIDIFIPEKRIAIELNGLYWHSFLSKERSIVQLTEDYHLSKTILSEQNKIELFHFWEHEVELSLEKVKGILESKLGLCKKLNARDLTVKPVDKKDERKFLEENHLQGFVGSFMCIGLWNDHDLIQLISIGKPRFAKDAQWELLRSCTKKSYRVVGGLSKLLHHIKKEVSGSMISYSERRLGNSRSYESVGFKLVRYTKPSYFYWKWNKNSLEIVSRYQAQKHKLPKLLGSLYREDKTERENMLDAGYGMTFDCGQAVYLINL